jgi:hypothetical protein
MRWDGRKREENTYAGADNSVKSNSMIHLANISIALKIGTERLQGTSMKRIAQESPAMHQIPQKRRTGLCQGRTTA